MKAYINGIGFIAPYSDNNLVNASPEFLPVPENGYLSCVEPDYKVYINPMVSRRMSRGVKMGIYSAMSCLADAGVEMPDAIVAGTGLGCIEDTEKFLISMITNEEKLLNPTPFIQSTHNTVTSQIALFLKCNGYNLTYSHRGFSFESALLDSLMQLHEGIADSVLTGGMDEITKHSYHLQARMGLLGRYSHTDILNRKTRGNLAGEGTAFFLLGNKPGNNCYAEISVPEMISSPADVNTVTNSLHAFLQRNQLEAGDIDLLLAGYGGDVKTDNLYDALRERIFPQTQTAYFKHLSGDYQTVTSFATALSARILKTQNLPDLLCVNKLPRKKIRNVLIYNHFLNVNHCFLLLQNVEL
jgi:3-oxoacyl-[acyl-carrier-protein] synthase II